MTAEQLSMPWARSDGAPPLAIHFVDTETTGLDSTAEVIDIAIVRWCDGDSKVLLNEKVKPRNGCSPEAARVNGYSEARWEGATPWDKECTLAVHELLKGAYIGGSNPAFDKRMIDLECARTHDSAPRWNHRELNTASLGFLLWVTGEVRGTGLGDLAAYFGVAHDAHTALGDCRAAIAVWEKMFDRFALGRT